MTPGGREIAMLLWGCVILFAVRVMGQFEALVLAPAWLPDMDAWYSGLLPYYLLLPVQVLLLMVMAVVAWNRRMRTGRFAAAHPRFVRGLRVFAVLYFAAMAVRLGIHVYDHGTEFWRAGAIPVAFHWVLALFLVVSARASPYQPILDEADDPHGDVPALTPVVFAGPDYRSN